MTLQHRLRALSIGLAAVVLLTGCEIVPSVEFRGSLEPAPEIFDGGFGAVDELSISVSADCDNAVDVGRDVDDGVVGIIVPIMPGGDAGDEVPDIIIIDPELGGVMFEAPDDALPDAPDVVNEFLNRLPQGTSVAPASGTLVADGRSYEVAASLCAIDPGQIEADGVTSGTMFFATDAAAGEVVVGFVGDVTNDAGASDRVFVLLGTDQDIEMGNVLAGRLVEDEPPLIDRFVGEGVYRLENVDLDRWLASDGDENRSNVVTNLDDSDRSRWEFIDNGDGTWLVRNVATGGYLDGDGANRDWNVDQSIAPSSDDRWIVTDVGNNEWSLRNAARNRLLDADRDHQDWNVDLSRALRGDRKWEFTLVG